MEIKYRAYFFTNMYISDIQRGIQPAHCISDMHMKYLNQSKILNDWAIKDKVMIVLNGGYSSHIKEIIDVLCVPENNLPWEQFYESVEALNNALTCVGIIIPDYIYETSKIFKKLPDSGQDFIINNDIFYNNNTYSQTSVSKWLIENLSNYSLA